MISHVQAEPLLRLDALELAYGDGKEPLFSGLSLQINAAQAFVLGGPSGVGKSTLLRCIAGLEARGLCKMHWQGRELVGHEMPGFRKEAIYVPQAPPRMPMSVEESLQAAFSFRHQTRSYSREAVLSLCEQLSLPEKLLGQRLADLSGGEAQRFGVVRALILEPKLLLLDEPASSLDATSRDALAELLARWLNEGSRALVVCSHEPSWCEKLVTDSWMLGTGGKIEHKAWST